MLYWKTRFKNHSFRKEALSFSCSKREVFALSNHFTVNEPARCFNVNQERAENFRERERYAASRMMKPGFQKIPPGN